MLSKEEILMSVQQGQIRPGWQVLHPKTSYLARMAITYSIVAIVVIILGIIFVSQNSYVFTPGFGQGTLDHSSFQTWRYIDEGALALIFLLCAVAALKYVLDLNTLQSQMLVMMSEGFLLLKGKTEQSVAYAGVTSISASASRYGNVTLHIRGTGTKAVYRVQFDGRFGNSRALASQIVSAQRAYASGTRARPIQS